MSEDKVGSWFGVYLSVLMLLAGACSHPKARSCESSDACPPGQHCSVQGVCVAADAGVEDAGLSTIDSALSAVDVVLDVAGCSEGVICGQQCCGASQVCSAGRCIDPVECEKDGQCADDTHCDKGRCIAYQQGQHQQMCLALAPVGMFSPAEQCSWTQPPHGDPHPEHRSVLGTPVVVDFDFDDDPETRQPSIVFVSYDRDDGSSEASKCAYGAFGVIRVIDGETCGELHHLTVDAARVRATSPLAVGDLDGDGRAEIVAARCGGGLVALRYNEQRAAFDPLWTSDPSTTGSWLPGWAGPAIHDLDDDGAPEILLWGTVWSSKGKLIDGSLGALAYGAGFQVVAADLDADGVVELADGHSVWKWGNDSWEPWQIEIGTRGQVAVADFGRYGAEVTDDDRAVLDGIAEIAVVSSGAVRVQTLDGRVVFGPVPVPGSGGGPPTVADLDGDGRVEVATAGRNSYSAFDPDCDGNPQPETCHTLRTDGILWTTLSQDFTSSATGSSVFDFEGDGAAEAVYADECFTRVYDGKSGDVLYAQWRSSCTWYEYPIIADVDGDFNSELVVPANDNCSKPDYYCSHSSMYDRHPETGESIDPLFVGLRCRDEWDCLSDRCNEGYCRCQTDDECGHGHSGFVCVPPKEGTAGGVDAGKVCRAAYKGKLEGVRVYRDTLDGWVHSRTIWNQHGYSVTHVREDGTIPKTSAWKLNWRQAHLNSFRQNGQVGQHPRAAPDLTVHRWRGLVCDSEGALSLTARVCNRGALPVAGGVPATFYRGTDEKQPLCIAKTERQLDSGICTVVRCRWQQAPTVPTDVLVVVDDDGTGRGENSECVEDNNTTLIKGLFCGEPPS